MRYKVVKGHVKAPVMVEKAGPGAEVLRKLRSFLDASEPELVYFLVNTWNAQGKAITYKELREAILAGEISADLLDEWMQDYNVFLVEHMEPAWRKAIETAAEEREKKFPLWDFNPDAEGVQTWVENHGAQFVTSVTQQQIQGLRAVVQRAAVLQDIGIDQMARAIRATVGLYHQQSVANLNYYMSLLKNGVSDQKALDLSIRYAARQHRYRAYLIARQELAMAYNTGAHEAVKQAQAAGYMGETVKVVSCAADERVCEICGELDGKIVGMDEEFNLPNKGNYRFTSLHPPFHIGCRCGIEYREIGPPIIR